MAEAKAANGSGGNVQAGPASGKDVSAEPGSFRCSRRYDLYTTTFKPAVRRSPACLVFHHGLSDHHARHADVLCHLAASLGMPVYTYDAHGHGRSGPLDGPDGGYSDRALIRSFDHMVGDLLDFTRQVVVPAEQEAAAAAAAAASTSGRGGQDGLSDGGGHPAAQRKPQIFLMGYSMGGLTACLAVAATSRPGGGGSDLYSGLMLTSCLSDALYGDPWFVRAVKMAFATTLSYLAPALPFFGRNPVEAGIRDPAAVEEMAKDTLWYRGKFKTATVASLLWGCHRLAGQCNRLTLPVYAQHGTKDVACSLGSFRQLLSRLRSTDVTAVVEEGAFHDLHHDPKTPELLVHMTNWLKARVKG
ncbi:hypothetical protein HYH02_005387 [Chlamydomonas schloesseri]|uniref:Serine aminopeptidase S33 domain-containing protein n=1 Tax=Chlamydomonas schloesseri TaxID=2026947 RepID=A0A835WLC8_9CHLO|nr:hypothetical protein HYH02_005387 [Chlamydomonas schloesseri]|eukprot:KAG2449864.1 hypothetical protein HYH02_005387 [Chlamydomonas schloesseri]